MKSDNWVGLNVSDIDRIQRISSTKYLSFFEATFFHKYLTHFLDVFITIKTSIHSININEVVLCKWTIILRMYFQHQIKNESLEGYPPFASSRFLKQVSRREKFCAITKLTRNPSAHCFLQNLTTFLKNNILVSQDCSIKILLVLNFPSCHNIIIIDIKDEYPFLYIRAMTLSVCKIWIETNFKQVVTCYIILYDARM